MNVSSISIQPDNRLTTPLREGWVVRVEKEGLVD